MRLKRAVDLDPVHANALVGLGFAYYRMQQLGEAEKFLRRALGVEPRNPYALRNLAAVLASSDKVADALPLFRTAHSIAPDDPATAWGLVQCLDVVGGDENDTEADRVSAEIIRRFPGSQFAQLAEEKRTAVAHKHMRAAVHGGMRPDVMFYIMGALDTFEALGPTRTRAITTEVAILGMSGLDINDPDPKYTLKSLPGKEFSGLHLVALMYTGMKQLDPGVYAGIDFSEEYKAAGVMRSRKD